MVKKIRLTVAKLLCKKLVYLFFWLNLKKKNQEKVKQFFFFC